MEKEFWLERWQNQQINFHKDEVHPDITGHIERWNNRAKRCIFVPLAGKSLDLLYLCSEFKHVYAVELVELAVKQFFEENSIHPTVTTAGKLKAWRHDNLTFYQGDFFDMDKNHLQGADALWDRACLIAFPPEMRELYARALPELLGAHETLLNTLIYDQTKAEGPPFSVDTADIKSLFPDYQWEQLESRTWKATAKKFQEAGIEKVEEKLFWLKKETAHP